MIEISLILIIILFIAVIIKFNKQVKWLLTPLIWFKDIIDPQWWAEKLSKANTSARGMLNQARRIRKNPDESFLNHFNIGDPDSSNHRRGFGSPEDVIDWFHQERSDDWRQRD